MSNIQQITDYSTLSSITFLYMHGTANAEENGSLMSLTFKLKDGVEKADISIAIRDCIDTDFTDLRPSLVKGTVKKFYELDYDANGGEGAPATEIKDHGVALTVSDLAPTREGFIFKGWSTSAQGEVEYTSGASFAENANVTLYAVWEEIQYSGECGNGLTWAFDVNSGELTISGSGDMADYSYLSGEAYAPAPWYIFAEDVKAVIINEGASSIGDNAFANCSTLAKITVPESVRSIGAGAFDGCDMLETVRLYKKSVADSYFDGNRYTKVYIVDCDFMVFDAYQVRIDSYNGLRSLFYVDLAKMPTLEKDGFKVVEYGSVMASSDNLAKFGDELIDFRDENGETDTLSYAAAVTVMKDDNIVGKYLEKNDEYVRFACTLTNFDKNTYDKNINIRGYAILEDENGDVTVVYCDYPDPEYRAVSLEMVCEGLAGEGAITEDDCISYADVLRFRREKEIASIN